VPIGDTVSDLVEAYLAEKDQTAIRAQGLRDAWKNSRPHFGHLRPDQITRLVCRDYTASRKRLGRKPATIRKEIEVVRAGLNYHKKAGSAVFELPPQPKPKERFLSRDEARRLSRAARGFPHIRGFIVLSLATGARGSALLDLTWDRVDFARGRIHLPLTEEDVRQKNRAVVPMNRRARRYLRVMRAAATCDHVIEWGGHRVLSVKKGFRSAAHKAGLTDVTPHTLRHTAASWMAIKGIRMFEISKYLGHSDARFTERRYAHLSPDHLRDAADALEW
jgi:integrase